MISIKKMALTAACIAALGGGIFTVAAGYEAKVQDPVAFAAEGDDVILIDIHKGTYTGGLKLENTSASDTDPYKGNVGYAVNGAKAVYDFTCKHSGTYNVVISFTWFKNASDWTFTVTDKATGRVEAQTTYNVTKVHDASFLLNGKITEGEKTLSIDLVGPSGYLANYVSFTLERAGDSYASVSNLTVSGAEFTPVAMAGYDWNYNVPVAYTNPTIDFKLDYELGTVAVTNNGATLTPNASGLYSIPTPESNAEATVDIKFTPDAGMAYNQTDYKARFFHLGDVKVTEGTIGGLALDEATLDALNKNGAATVNSYVFTSVPALNVAFIDGLSAAGTLKSQDDTKAVYTFTGKSGDVTKDFTLTVDGIHVYTKAAADLDKSLRFDQGFIKDDSRYDDGLFTVSPTNSGWGGTQFKFKPGVITVTIPSDMLVKQLTLGGFSDNYAPGKVTSVATNADATVYLPTASNFNNPADANARLVVNIENHKAGAPFEITIEGGSQPVFWFDFVYEEQKLTTPVEMKEVTASDLTGKNHVAITFAFDREVKDATVKFGDKDIKADGGSSALVFSLWNLEYDKEYTFTIPAGAITDSYGNSNAQAFTYTFKTGKADAPVEAIAADRFVIVKNVEELRAAVAALAGTNNKADSPLTVIYIANGDYDLGSDALNINKLYNISLIGESKEGVLIHGTKDGISNPVFSTRYSTNIYMENFTLRNDLDFGKPERVGVGVAHYGGNLDIMKNVELQSIQDTQVTGERGYYINCTIHGNCDYICGGGDHFYDNCTLVHRFEGGYITAPSTSPANKYGYVFSNCTIKGDANYALARPWQNEPRCYWLNTTMEALASADGWGGMSTLTTHFYEFGSKDANGNLVDLSGRKNSSTSVNKYTPVLTADEAALFTVENVLGGNDSWLATELTAELEAPVAKFDGSSINWEAVKGAAGYLVYVDGTLLGYTPNASYVVVAPAEIGTRATSVYTVQAISANGAKGVMSAAADDNSTAVIELEAAGDAVYFNFQGQRVDGTEPGMYIRVVNGVATKVIVK